ncbi:MAG TPA: hypothetical protein PK095_16470 [Myxococcota bacterium]|nr:hypothetical protein [Myxococcota bacterium]
MRCFFLLAFALSGCGSDHHGASADPGGLDPVETLDGAAPGEVGAEDGLAEMVEPDGTDPTEDTAEPAPMCPAPLMRPAEPVSCEGPCLCPVDFACDVPLASHGVCPGRCVRVSRPLVCEGVVRWGACLAKDLRTPGYPSLELPRVTVRVTSGPHLDRPARVGERHLVTLEIRSRSGEPSSLRFGFSDSRIQQVLGTPWVEAGARGRVDAGARLEVPGDRPLILQVEVLARVATQLIELDPAFATFTFDDVPFQPGFPVLFGELEDEEVVACGGHRFPEAWDESGDMLNSPARYGAARCCGDVFFAEADCCDDSECGGGRCIDGVCQISSPANVAATRLPLGHVRVRALFPLRHGQELSHGVNDFRDYCGDRADELREVLRLDETEAWFDDLALRRLGRPTVTLGWTVTAFDADRFEAMEPNVWFSLRFRELLSQHLVELGCEPLAQADLVVIPGAGEEWFQSMERQDRAFLIYFDSQHRATERLARMFGGERDRPSYSLISRRLPDCLIAGNHSEPLPWDTDLPCEPLPRDQLLWGALGFSDLDRDGVIDIAQHSAYPTALVVQNVRATLGERALLVEYEIAAREGKGIKRRVVTEHALHLPELGVVRTSTSNRRIHRVEVPRSEFTNGELDSSELERSGSLTLRVTARDAFFDPEWRHRTLMLDVTRTVPLTLSR